MWWKRENPNSSRSLCSAASSLTCKAWSRLAPTHLNNQILTWYDLAHWHLSWPKFGMKECSLTTFNLCWTFPFLPHLKVGSFIPTFRHDMFLNWTTRQLPWTRPAMRTSSMRRDAPLCTSCARASSVLASPTPRRTFRSGSPNAEHNKSRQLSDLSHPKVTSTHINHQILVPEQHSSFKLPSWYCAPPGTCGKALVDLERSRPFASRPWKSKWRQLQSWKLKLFVCWNGPGLTETWEFPHKTSGLLQKKSCDQRFSWQCDTFNRGMQWNTKKSMSASTMSLVQITNLHHIHSKKILPGCGGDFDVFSSPNLNITVWSGGPLLISWGHNPRWPMIYPNIPADGLVLVKIRGSHL